MINFQARATAVEEIQKLVEIESILSDLEPHVY